MRTASAPSTARLTWWPICSSTRRATFWLTGWSSTSRMSSAGSCEGAGRVADASRSATSGRSPVPLARTFCKPSSRSDGVTGLTSQAPTPSSAHSATPLRCSCAGSSITVRPGGAAAAGMACITAKPDRSGMPASSTSTSKGGAAASRHARAWRPPSATVTSIPHAPSRFASQSRWVALSSATNTRRPCSEPLPDGRTLASAPTCKATGTVSTKRLPRSTSLDRLMRPPINCARPRAIARPRPVPPKRRVTEASACENASNTSVCSADGMPIPVSRTRMSRVRRLPCTAPLSDTSTHTSPCSVNLIALPTRLVTIWRRRTGSPTSASGTSGEMQAISSSCFSKARTASGFRQLLSSA